VRTYFFVDTSKDLPTPPLDPEKRNITPLFACKADSVEDARRLLFLSKGIDAARNPHIQGSWVPVNNEPQ